MIFIKRYSKGSNNEAGTTWNVGMTDVIYVLPVCYRDVEFFIVYVM